MNKWIICLILCVIPLKGVYAKEKGNPQTQLGTGAYEGHQSAMKWGVAVGSVGVAAVVFALIIILASTDPTSFEHSH